MSNYYIGPDGSDGTGTGTIGNPYFTITKAIGYCSAGDSVIALTGIYNYATQQTINKSGTVGNYITITSETGNPNDVIFDFWTYDVSTLTPQQIFGIYSIDCSCINITGITIKRLWKINTNNGQAYGFYMQNANNIIFNFCVADHIAGRGFQIHNSRKIYYYNCDAIYCADPQLNDPGNGGTGFTSTMPGSGIGSADDIILYQSCRAWQCADQGFSAGDPYVHYNNCWSFANGLHEEGYTFGSQGGFKPGYSFWDTDPIQVLVTNCLSVFNGGMGFNENTDGETTNKMNFRVYNNLFAKNGLQGIMSTYQWNNLDNINEYKNNISFDNGSWDLQIQQSAVHSYNSFDQPYYNTLATQYFDSPASVSEADFIDFPINKVDCILILGATRKYDGSLPNIGNYFKLKIGSDLIGAGTDVSLIYDAAGNLYNNPPSMGPFEYNLSLIIEGSTFTYVSSDYQGLNIPRNEPTTLIVKNNLITTNSSTGYMLQCGDDAPSINNNNLDNAIITGNILDWSGTDLTATKHGIMAGYNINYDIKYNYFDSIPYGVVIEGSSGMTYTSGGVMYNIFKNNTTYSVLIGGQNNVPVYNNIFYTDVSTIYFVGVVYHEQFVPYALSTGAKIKNNIFYAGTHSTPLYSFIKTDTSSLVNFECDYNIYWKESGDHTPNFTIDNSVYTWAQWRALGYDTHSIIKNPNFIDTSSFVPAARLDNGINSSINEGLSIKAYWSNIDPSIQTQNGLWQIGAYVYPAVNLTPGAYYVKTDGSDNYSGLSDASAWKTFQKAVNQTVAGNTVYFRGGIYEQTQSVSVDTHNGTISNPINFLNYPFEFPIFDGSLVVPVSHFSAGLHLAYSNYLNFKGLTFKNYIQITNASIANDVDYVVGVYSHTCNNITLENITTYNIWGNGFQNYNCASIYHINCDAYDCADPLRPDPGNGGCGFSFTSQEATQFYGGPISYVGCRAWHASDDGFHGQYTGLVILDKCWSWNNGYLAGSGNGFKPGWILPDVNPLARKITNCIAVNNLSNGFHENSYIGFSRINGEWFNNIAYRNGGYGFDSMNNDLFLENQNIYRNNISYDNSLGAFIALVASVHDHNSWDSSITVSSADFINLDTTQLNRLRKINGSLPDVSFGHLAANSDLIHAGTYVGLTYDGAGSLWNNPPSIGAYEYSYTYPDSSTAPFYMFTGPSGLRLVYNGRYLTW